MSAVSRLKVVSRAGWPDVIILCQGEIAVKFDLKFLAVAAYRLHLANTCVRLLPTEALSNQRNTQNSQVRGKKRIVLG